VLLAGIGHATDSAEVTRRGSFTSFNSTRQAAMQAYAMAGVNPGEVDFAEVHDAFTIFEVIGSEDLGLFPPGKGWQAALQGQSEAEGLRPVNPSGGLKARGHPVGASGLAQVVEAYWLLTGQVEPERRLPREPRIALAHSIGGLGNNNLVTILTLVGDDARPTQTWRPEFSPEIYPPSPPRPDPLPDRVYGRVRGATVLYNPPEGFDAPLGLCLARTSQGWATLAHMDPRRPLLTGARVRLDLRDGLYFATGVGDPAWPWLSMRRVWRRIPGALHQLRPQAVKRPATS
jgi:acetyl-CoA C-acetyltransferase